MAQFLRRFWLHLLLIVSPTVLRSEEIPPFTLQDFKLGLVTEIDSSDICDTCSQDLQNVDVKSGYIEKRRGSLLQNSSAIGNDQPIRFLHEYIDSSNNFWLLFVTSNTLYGSKDGGGNNQILTSTFGITSTSRFSATNAFGKAYLVDGSTNVIIFDGTTVTASTSIPKGTTIEFFAERLVVGGVSGSASTLYMSEAGDPEDWTTDTTLDSDAFSTQIRQANGYPIRSVKRFRSGLMVFKDNSMDFFTLSADGLTFSQTPVSSRIGTTFPETVHSADNVLRWLAFDGFYEYNGAIITRISEPIQATIENLSQLSSASRYYTETSQTSFSAGTSSGTSITVVADSVVLSTWTDLDTTGADFAAGTLTNLTTQTVDGALYLSTTNTNMSNNSFESGSGTDADNWTEGTHAIRTSTSTTAQSGTYSMIGTSDYTAPDSSDCSQDQTSASMSLRILDTSGSTLESRTFSVTTSWVQQSIDMTAYAGRSVKFNATMLKRSQVGVGGCGFAPFESVAISDTFLANGSTITFYVKAFGTGNKQIAYDLFENGVSTITSGSILSQIFDTTLSSATWMPSTPTYNANGHTLTFTTQVSNDGVTFDSTASWTPGSAPTSANKRYIQYRIDFATSSTGTALPFVSDVTLAARQRSGRYISPSFSISGATSWLPFDGTVTLNDGSQTFELYLDTDSSKSIANGTPVAGTYISSQTITDGATPSIPIGSNTFAFIGSTFTITAATQAPQMDDFTVNWAEGSSTFYPVSMFFDQDSYWALSISSPTGNDSIFIFDQNRAWTKYTDLPVFYMSLYRTRPYFGSSEAGDIVRFQVTDLYTDFDGGAIDAYWISKDFDMGFPLTPKTLLRYYITAGYSTTSNLDFSYGPNRGSLFLTSHDLDSLLGFYRSSIKPSSYTYSEGLQHRFKFSDDTNNSYFRVLSITGRFNLLTSP